MPSAGPQTQHERQSPSLLLALPEPLLLAVLQRLTAAGDQRSLFRAARAHSRLRQAAGVTLSSIAVQGIKQQALDSVLLYLGRHGQHVHSVALGSDPSMSTTLGQLPPCCQLNSLQLHSLGLQLLPGGDFQGVLGPAAELSALKQLRLDSCKLLDDMNDSSFLPLRGSLAAALKQLPGLQHLRCDLLYSKWAASRVSCRRVAAAAAADLP